MLFYPNIVVVQNRVQTRILHTGRNLTFDQNVLIKVTAHISKRYMFWNMSQIRPTDDNILLGHGFYTVI